MSLQLVWMRYCCFGIRVVLENNCRKVHYVVCDHIPGELASTAWRGTFVLVYVTVWILTLPLYPRKLQGCNCSHATATDVSSDSSIWRATWMSDYCKGTLYSWASASVSLPFCFALCICRRVVPALFIQAGLHFCRCPTFIHQTVTLSFISSLLYTQLSVPLSEFVWCRVIPMSVVTLAFVARILVFAAQTVGGLQKAKDDFRNLLEQALISFDYLYSSIILTQLFAMGLLLAVSPRMSP